MLRSVKLNLARKCPPNLPDNLQTGGAVLVVLGVGLQVVNVDVRQTREEQLQLLLVEDGDQPESDDAMFTM